MNTHIATSDSPIIVVTPPPTPNGRLHIGHVAGPYLRADLFTRFTRFLSTQKIYHVSHIDTYQSYVPKKAQQLGLSANELMKQTCSGIKEDFKSYGIHHDLFIDNESVEYLSFLNSAVKYSIERLEISEAGAKFCTACETALFESYLKGYCQYCFHDCYQNVCENCSLPQEQHTLLFPTCEVCGGNESRISDTKIEQRLVISQKAIDATIEKMLPQCRGNRRLTSMFRNLRPHEIGLSFSTDYGVFPSALNGAMNAWVEIYFAHFYSVLKICGIDTGRGFEVAIADFQKLPNSPRIVNFFGVDNSYYYSFLFPYISEKLGIPGMIPVATKASYFLQLNDAKISSSRNNVIWAKELRETGRLEELRTNLAFSCPEFSPRNYGTTANRVPYVNENSVVAASDSSEALQALRNRLKIMLEPLDFSVEGLMNAFDKWNAYSSHDMRDAKEIKQFLVQLAKHLSIA
ncbi:class I tRNA ligase family protein [Leptospira santarosai]|uniref:class I tRNA ligase family protein n=1 Tax=Leptospira santarosai TaxID=28183 RepID=UPI0024AFA423|nr:class I tRNA ligase family protein [Leptospira santarosai]MDI7174953.1 class I tRNA ligase family protein [Leptospira santarosai]MDI7194545.1 class I tRNA ligase family protein [Leptospira santarosai]MDO6399004.1 class I tRNA ligase family protein [Leptospira santarosai]MDO6404387.1 class I tRNA ligase family protein [Leptospira santarosai]